MIAALAQIPAPLARSAKNNAKQNKEGVDEKAANPEANIIFGATIDENFNDELRVTVIATGFDQTMGGSVFVKKEEPKVVEVFEAEAPVAAPVKKAAPTQNIEDIDAVLSIFKR